MKDIWNVLEERTRTWEALGRQGLADTIWADYVSVRFGRTGNPRALEYLYPYLNHAQKQTRLKALGVAARVFEGRGQRAIDDLDYFIKNPDPFLRDRAAQVVGATVTGSGPHIILHVLAPYLNHRNQFVRKRSLVALGKACAGRGNAKVLAEIQRTASEPLDDESRIAIAEAFAGRPTEEVYALVADPKAIRYSEHAWDEYKVAYPVSILVRGASDEWYERACKEIFEPRLHVSEERRYWFFVQRNGVEALCNAAPGHGMEALGRMLHLRNNRCTLRAIMSSGQKCFAGADPEANRAPLIDLARNGDLQEQRIAAVCLGAMMMGTEDDETIGVLRELCDARNKAVQTAALTGLGMAALSTCNEELRKLCLDRALGGETTSAAILALGTIFLGSGRADVFKDIRTRAEIHRRRPVRGRRHCKPLAVCYWATGLVYLGTGSTEPIEFLLDVLALPRVSRTYQYQWLAAKALVMIEFSESAILGIPQGRFVFPRV